MIPSATASAEWQFSASRREEDADGVEIWFSEEYDGGFEVPERRVDEAK